MIKYSKVDYRHLRGYISVDSELGKYSNFKVILLNYSLDGEEFEI